MTISTVGVRGATFTFVVLLAQHRTDAQRLRLGTEAPTGPNPTIADYVVDAGLTEAPIFLGDANAPRT
ncbi:MULTISPECIES: hypothetical protein [unclassified Rhodococcus (in: high G+C Gram-positive bacteria)]|uniref:hypothetical protein n=1 Tax=unclassified Rhodococcus (in: high G+C Gram-positive bacteria) TaxID=192944 RepID=UPI000B9BFBC1|nr:MULTISPECIES: hypothetical protein [unclassified Rhodococcus (in: high G+C Gram-positive bacteria)]OZE39934.1 hypothetical protein CH259_04490 [Rhodococcus sp. 05-2254-4]OZE49502.1 hypothetical protein CH261_02925 [Rhodococcus sp. 05-2254-3]OZE50140.1 hypothetical protein CH283_10230 [Rhodococcus sp. 05-2254-2]